ncbi:MAG: stalk domain-containing protein, partial [Lachnospirales bacterium]
NQTTYWEVENVSVPNINGRVYLPVRIISETLGYDVKWTNATSTVDISTEKMNISAPSDAALIKTYNDMASNYENNNIYNNEVYNFDDLEKGDKFGNGTVIDKYINGKTYENKTHNVFRDGVSDFFLKVDYDDFYKGKISIYYDEFLNNTYVIGGVDPEFYEPTLIIDGFDFELKLNDHLEWGDDNKINNLLTNEEIEYLKAGGDNYIDFYIEVSDYYLGNYKLFKSNGFLEVTKLMKYEDYLSSR